MQQVFIGPSLRLSEKPVCPVCGAILDGCSSFDMEPRDDDWRPYPGCFTVCAYCTTTLRYEIGLTLRVAEKEDLKELYDNAPEIFALLQKLLVASKQIRTDRRRAKYKRN